MSKLSIGLLSLKGKLILDSDEFSLFNLRVVGEGGAHSKPTVVFFLEGTEMTTVDFSGSTTVTLNLELLNIDDGEREEDVFESVDVNESDISDTFDT